MSESKNPNSLTSEELAALLRSSGAESANGISATEARVLHEISLSASQSAKHFGTLAGTQADGKTFVVSVDQASITAFGSAACSVLSQALLPQISQNSQHIKDLGDRLKHGATQISSIESELRNIQHTLRLTSEHLHRLQRDEIMAELSQGIRGELLELIAAEWSERFQQLEARQTLLESKCEDLQETGRQRAESGQPGTAEPPNRRSTRPTSGDR